MKIFYIDPQSYNNLSLYDKSLLSAVKGHHVTYYYSSLYQYKDLPGDVNKCYFSYSNKKSSLSKALSYTLSIMRLTVDVLVHRPEIVHVQWLRLWYIDYLFAMLLKFLRIRVIFTAHNILPHVQHPSDKQQYRKYYHLVNDIIVHNVRTRDELSDMMGIDKSKIHVIHHGVFDSDVSCTDAARRAGELRNQLGILPNQIVFSCLGVQKPYKGTEMVVKVWAESEKLRNSDECFLIIAGRNHGLDYSPLKGMSNVYILDDMLTDLDFEAYLQLSSVVLLPYLCISQSGLLFSAVNRNTPSLVTDVGGLTEPLAYGKIGWNIGSPSESSLKNEMLRLLDNKEEIAKMKNNSDEYDKVRKMYSWSNIGKQTSELYSAR